LRWWVRSITRLDCIAGRNPIEQRADRLIARHGPEAWAVARALAYRATGGKQKLAFAIYRAVEAKLGIVRRW
jgi:hypothetical protein